MSQYKPRTLAPITSLVSSFTRNRLDSGFFVLKNAVIIEPSSSDRRMSFTLCMSFGTDSDLPPAAATAMFAVLGVFFSSPVDFMDLGLLLPLPQPRTALYKCFTLRVLSIFLFVCVSISNY